MSGFYKVLLWITSVASALCLSLVIWSVIYSASLTKADKNWQQKTDEELQSLRPLPGAKESAPGGVLTAEQKLELQQSVAGTRALLMAEIHAADSDERAILDRLITLVGVFSAILGLCAFATVRLAREDALAQQNRIEKDLKNFKETTEGDLKAFQTKTEGDLKALTERTGTQIDEFRKQIWSELPEMRNLKESLHSLMLELERTIPSESDWNEAVAYDRLSVMKRESILIAESTVNALQIFVSRDATSNVATQARLYSALARFYFGRFRANCDEADAERADLYARRAGEMEPEASSTDRLRGAIATAQYRILKKKAAAASQPVSQKDTEKFDALLAKAEGFLKLAMSKDGSDAGAAVNLALVARYRDDLDRAIQVSQDAIDKRGEMTSQNVQKYLPSLYLNLACYLARKAENGPDAKMQTEKRNEVVELLQEAMKYLRERKNLEGVTAFSEMILRENQRHDAFKNLSKENLDALDALVTPENI